MATWLTAGGAARQTNALAIAARTRDNLMLRFYRLAVVGIVSE